MFYPEYMNAQIAHLLSHCPFCKQPYQPGAVKRLGDRLGAQIYHCTCTICQRAMVAVVLEQIGMVSSLGMVTDLEINDALRFYQATPIQKNECVEMHRMLDAESQEFCKILKNP